MLEKYYMYSVDHLITLYYFNPIMPAGITKPPIMPKAMPLVPTACTVNRSCDLYFSIRYFFMKNVQLTRLLPTKYYFVD